MTETSNLASVAAMAPYTPAIATWSRSDRHTMALGRALGALWATRPSPWWVFVSLTGPLGAGKTHVAKGIVEGLGGDPTEVTSPTFALLNVYRAAHAEVHHADCYRLTDDFDARDVGLEASLIPPTSVGARRVTLVEWAARLPGLIPVEGGRLAPYVRDLRLLHAGLEVRRVLGVGFSADERAAIRSVRTE